MQIKEHKTKKLPSLIGSFRLNRTWTMDEDIMTGKITNKELHEVRLIWTR